MSEQGNGRDVGILILRVGLGIIFMIHGFPKLAAGPEMWKGLGGAMGTLGLGFAPTFWGFMAGFAEFFGGLCLIVGVFFRLFCFLLAFTMLVATLMHLSQHQGFTQASHAMALLVVFVGLLIMGAGRFSLGEKLTVPFLK